MKNILNIVSTIFLYLMESKKLEIKKIETKDMESNNQERSFFIDIQLRQSILLDTYLIITSTALITIILKVFEKYQLSMLNLYKFLILSIPVITIISVITSLFVGQKIGKINLGIIDKEISYEIGCEKYINLSKWETFYNQVAFYFFIASMLLLVLLFVFFCI